jgi:hypothetical protein
MILHVLPTGIKREYFDYKPEEMPSWINENLLAYKRGVQGWIDRMHERYQRQREKQKQQQQQDNETANINLKIDMADLMTSVAGTIASYAEEKEADLVHEECQILSECY